MHNKTNQNKLPLWKIIICVVLSILLSFYAFQKSTIQAFALDSESTEKSNAPSNETINENNTVQDNTQPKSLSDTDLNNEEVLLDNIQQNPGVEGKGKKTYEYTDSKTGIKYVYEFPADDKDEDIVKNSVKKFAGEKKWDEKKNAIKKAALNSIKDVANGFFKAAMIDENGKFRINAKVLIEAIKDAALSFLSAGLGALLGPWGGVAGSILTGAVNWLLTNIQNIGNQACKPNTEAYVMSRDTSIIIETMNIKIGALESKLNDLTRNLDEVKKLINNGIFADTMNSLKYWSNGVSDNLNYKLFNHADQKEQDLFKGVSAYKIKFKTDAQGNRIKDDNGLYIVDENQSETVYTNFTKDLTPSVIINTCAQYKKDVIDKKAQEAVNIDPISPTSKEKSDNQKKLNEEDNVESLTKMSEKMMNFYKMNVFNQSQADIPLEKWIFDLKEIVIYTKKTLYKNDWSDGQGSRILFNDYADLIYTSLVNKGKISKKEAVEATIEECDALGLKIMEASDLCTRLLDFYFAYEALNGMEPKYEQDFIMKQVLGTKDAAEDKDKNINILISQRTNEIREKYSNLLKAKVTNVLIQDGKPVKTDETYYESFDEAWKEASDIIVKNSSSSRAVTVSLLGDLVADLNNGFAKNEDKNDTKKGFINDGALFVNSSKAQGCSLTLDLNGYSIYTYKDGYKASGPAWDKPLICLDCPYGKDGSKKATEYVNCSSNFNLINSQFGYDYNNIQNIEAPVPLESSDDPIANLDPKGPTKDIAQIWPNSKIVSKNSVLTMRGRQGDPDQWTPINCHVEGIVFEKCEKTVINWLGGILASSYNQKENICKLRGYDELSIKNCTFQDIKAKKAEGAIKTFWYAHYTIEDTKFIKCRTTSNGGAINSSCSYIKGYEDQKEKMKDIQKTNYRVIPKFNSDYHIDNNQIKGKLNVNSPDYYNLIYNSSLTDEPKESISINKYPPMVQSSKQDVYTCEKVDNLNTQDVLWNKYKTDMCNIISNCTFTDLECAGYGGALALNTSTYLRNCKFERCTSNSAKGGAIAKIDEDFFEICAENCTFDGCKAVRWGRDADPAYSGGGAVYIERINNAELPKASRIFNLSAYDIVNGKIDYSPLQNCLDKGYPVYGLYLKNCTLNNNNATNGKGGSVYSCGFAVKCESCNFDNSKSGSDGSVSYIRHPSREKTVQDDGWETASCFYSCKFNNCKSENGSGSLYFFDEAAIVGGSKERTTIKNCKTKGDGSAIMMVGSTVNKKYHRLDYKRNDLVLYNADITNNEAGGFATVFLNNGIGHRYSCLPNNNVLNNVNITNNTIRGRGSDYAGVYCEAWYKTKACDSKKFSNVELGGLININNNHSVNNKNMGGIKLGGSTRSHDWTKVLYGKYNAEFDNNKSKLPGMGNKDLNDSSNIIISTEYRSSKYDFLLGEEFNNNQLKIFNGYSGDGNYPFYIKKHKGKQMLAKQKGPKRGK